MRIEASLHVIIEHRSGPVIADPNHVRTWLIADGHPFKGETNGFSYTVCPNCPDPETCKCYGVVSTYRVRVGSVSED